jgi:beta-glucuronidase
MKRILIALCLLAGPAFAATTPANLIANLPGRTTISLDGAWRAIVDPYETGIGGRFYENAKPKDKHEILEYDFDASPVMNVPGDWNSQRADLFFYEGPVWYKKSFSYHKREHERVFVYFGAANYRAVAYLNGKKIGEH